MPTVYIPGNHEYYHHDIELTDQLRAAAPNNIRMLNNDSFEIDGIRVPGCTLWTDFKFYGADEVELSQL